MTSGRLSGRRASMLLRLVLLIIVPYLTQFSYLRPLKQKELTDYEYRTLSTRLGE